MRIAQIAATNTAKPTPASSLGPGDPRYFINLCRKSQHYFSALGGVSPSKTASIVTVFKTSRSTRIDFSSYLSCSSARFLARKNHAKAEATSCLRARLNRRWAPV
jgi:hypothetical protein